MTLPSEFTILHFSTDLAERHRDHFAVPPPGPEASRPHEPEVPEQDPELEGRHRRVDRRVPRTSKSLPWSVSKHGPLSSFLSSSEAPDVKTTMLLESPALRVTFRLVK